MPGHRIVFTFALLYFFSQNLFPCFFFLKPFLAHPWYHLAYWLTMYLVLFFAAPVIFFPQERKSGGKLPVRIRTSFVAKAVAFISMVTGFITSLFLFFNIDGVNSVLPWNLPPLVGGLMGVLFLTHAAAYAWALWDGDWIRVRPIFWQAPPTALMLILLPIAHAHDLKDGSGWALLAYLFFAGVFLLMHGAAIGIGMMAERKAS